MNCIKTFVSIMLLCVATVVAYAQQAAYGVKGVVVDVENYTPLKGATITIANSPLGTTTNEKGEFFIPLPSDKASEYLIRASIMGYDAQEVKFTLGNTDTEFVSFALKNKDAVIEEVVVTRRREKASELALLEERRKSNLMVESIGTQELSRKGVSDARAALTKMAGVSRQEGAKNVFVRGLGDRYNSSSLNGLPLPSEDPLYKNISLDFFSSDVIQSINVNKTFNSQIGGDVAGANVDIFTKEATGNSLEIAISGGGNSQTVGADNFRRIDGTNWFGSLPGGSKPNITDFSQYSFKNKWNPNAQNNLFNSSFRILGNRRFMLGNNPLSLFFVGSMDSKYKKYDGLIQQSSDAGSELMSQKFVTNEYKVAQSAMLNLRYGWDNNALSFNSLYIHDQTQDLRDFSGRDVGTGDGDNDIVYRRRQQVNDNHIFVNQLHGKLNFNDTWSADLGAGLNYAIGNEPDRRLNTFIFKNNNLGFSYNSSGENQRYFSNMTETGLVSKAIVAYKIANEGGLDRKIEVGYNGNHTQRDFDFWELNHKMLAAEFPTIDMDNVDAILNQEGAGKYFDLSTDMGGSTVAEKMKPFFYRGKKQVNSALASGTYQFSEAFTAILGFRYDQVNQTISFLSNTPDFSTNNFTKLNKGFFLPSLNLKYNLNEKMIVRASGSKTYTLPQFIELAPMRYRGNNNFTQGNPELIPSTTYNADVKWEMYPENGELVAVTAFFKKINDPISRVEVPSAGNTLTFLNVGKDAQVYGLELEVKKDLIKSENTYGTNVLSGGLNVAYLHSVQNLIREKGGFSNDKDKLEGASPVLLNADLSYKMHMRNLDLQPSVVFNYFADRVYSIGTAGYQNIIEKGIPSLDFVLQSTLKKKIGINVKAENILNPERKLLREFSNGQPDFLLESYKRGVDFSLGLSYKF